VYIEKSDIKNATNDIEYSLILDSSFARANYVLGMIYLSQQDTTSACKYLSKANGAGVPEITSIYNKVCKF
jgi:Tfp pilus assembly protein PilF